MSSNLVRVISGDGIGPARRTATALAGHGGKTQPVDALPEGAHPNKLVHEVASDVLDGNP